jgi:hypothetical protein
MSTEKETLEITCKIHGFSSSYLTGDILWSEQQAQLTIDREDEGQIGILKVWQKKVAPECIKEERAILSKKLESFLLGFKFLGNRRILTDKQTVIYYIEKGTPFSVRNDIDIKAIIKRSKGEEYNYIYGELPSLQCKMEMTSEPIPFPVDVPNIPLKFKRFILTVLQAEDLDDYSEIYQDEKLKRWFLILEELHQNKKAKEYINIKCARHFVSHSTCHGQEVITFLKKELPSSVYTNKGNKEEAKFLRDNPLHLSLITKYENKARTIARNLITEQIALFNEKNN